MNTTILVDTSDLEAVCTPLHLYLKPLARISICVALPQLKSVGQAISNWEVMEKIKGMVAPNQFNILRVTKSTLDYVRFEGELENKSLVSMFVDQLDGKFIKLSGFSSLLKITAGEAKVYFPAKHDWESFFRDSKTHDPLKYGEKPDTVHLSNVPCKFFSHSINGLSENIVKQAFCSYGEIRNIDIPMLDPYRSEISTSAHFQTFTFGSQLNFEVYIQYKEYIGFDKCMTALKGKKLVYKEDDKTYAALVKVDFDKTKHLSAAAILHRQVEKRKIEKLQREREQKKRFEKEALERKKKEEKLKDEQRRSERINRRKRREEKRKKKQEALKAADEAKKQKLRIEIEERKMLLAQRKLQAMRLLTYLFEEVKGEYQKEEIEKLEKEIEEKAKQDRKRLLGEQQKKEVRDRKKKIKLEVKEEQIKNRILQRKKFEEFKKDNNRREEAIQKLNPGKLCSAVVCPKP